MCSFWVAHFYFYLVLFIYLFIFVYFCEEISAALQVLEQIQETIDASEDEKLRSQTKADLNILIRALQNPILRSIATIQV